MITEVSGRGLGLAIVKEKVMEIGGQVSVETETHVGTQFQLTLPPTLATFRGILIEASGQSFVIPTAHVERVLRVPTHDVFTVENKTTISLDEQMVPLVRLQDVLEQSAVALEEQAEFVRVVVMGRAEKRIAFGVDKILTEQAVLVKGLGTQLSRVRNIAGATVLGSGALVPILNVSDLMKAAGTDFATNTHTIEEKKYHILVVEDSTTSRMLLQNILESSGYRVSTAVDGMDALTTLRRVRFDLVVSDVDMPRLNGFNLISKIRAEKEIAELPVVLVTSLESMEDRERGVLVGASAYIIKSHFDQSNLLAVIHRLIKEGD